jgi:hypothetical protein
MSTTGSVGTGGLGSSKLTRLLQEKAEQLKQRRQRAEAAVRAIEDDLRILSASGVAVPDPEARTAALKELLQRGDWDGAEARAREFAESMAKLAPPAFDERRRSATERAERLAREGRPAPPEFARRLDEASRRLNEGAWADALREVGAAIKTLGQAESEFASSLIERVRALVRWAGASEKMQTEADAWAASAAETVRSGRIDPALQELSERLRRELPEAERRRTEKRGAADALVGVARDLGVPTAGVEAALESDRTAPPLDWPESVGRVESASQTLAEAVRERALSAVEVLRETLQSLREFGVDPGESLATVEDARARLPNASLSELPPLLSRARSATEGPLVDVVASLLDEVRPRLVEARRLGRDPSDVLAAMNRAREALRLKIYSEALAASQEAAERAQRLTSDLDTARAEAESLRILLDHLRTAKFSALPPDDPLGRVTDSLDRGDIESARRLLEDTVRRLGRDALGHFEKRLADLERWGKLARGWGFLPGDFDDRAAQVRERLAEGELGEAAEGVAALESGLRSAAAPYVARRVEEIEKGAQELPDQSRVGAVRRHLADADVGLRVKEDLPGALESLQRAEREFSALFAEYASTLVEALAEEGRVLESMGGAGDEIERQIDEVQQIFNMGDFVKAFRASQEIRTRTHQQQLVRTEEAVSHAKLALVELGKMGLDTGSLKGSLEAAQEALRLGEYPNAYRRAVETHDAAQRLRGLAQSILDMIGESTTRWQKLLSEGVPLEVGPEQVAEAKTAYRSLDFERARSLLASVEQRWDLSRARWEADRCLSELAPLLEDAGRLGVPVDSIAERGVRAKSALEGGNEREAAELARGARDEAVSVLRPVLDEYLKHLERDVDVARQAGLDASVASERLADARRALAAPVPKGAAALADAARDVLAETQGFLEHAERLVRRAQESADQAELLRVDVAESKAKLETARARIASRKYARAIQLAGEVERDTQRGVRDQVGKTLAGFQASLTRARREGADTALADNLLEQARHRLEDGQAVEALQVAARSESELERVELQLRIAESSLAQVEAKLAAATVNGLAAPEAAAHLRHAREAFDAREFPRALERSLAALDELSAAAEGQRRAREAIDAAERQTKVASELGADAEDARGTLEAARGLARAGDYVEATRKARDATERALWATERIYAGPLEEVRANLEILRGEGVSEAVSRIETEVRTCEEALASRDWSRAGESLARTREVSREALNDGLDAIEESRSALGEPDGAEKAVREEIRKAVDEARARGDFRSAFATLRDETERVREGKRAHLARELESLHGALLAGEKLGVDTTPVMELFSEAKLALEAGTLDAVPESIARGRSQLDELLQPRLDARIREIESELLFAREGLNVALGPLPERLGHLRAEWDARRPKDAARSSQDALEIAEELQRRKALHRELLNLHYLVDAALARAADRRLDTEPARRILEESLRARSTDYSVALEKAREALALLREQLGGEVADAGAGPGTGSGEPIGTDVPPAEPGRA